MTVSIKELREYSEKFGCKVECDNCPFQKTCKHIDEQNFKYKPQLIQLVNRSENKEVPIDSSEFIVLPKLNKIPEQTRKKLFDLILAIVNFNLENKKCSVKSLAEYMNISLYLVNKRLNYLLAKDIIQTKKTSKGTIIELFDKDEEKDIRYKELKSFYVMFFKEAFNNSPELEPADFIMARTFAKKTEYSVDQLRELMRGYFRLKTFFLRNNGFKLRYFPDQINSILVENPGVMNIKSTNSAIVLGRMAKISEEQIQKYLEGKKNGKWTGTEEWAQEYEAILKNRTEVTL